VKITVRILYLSKSFREYTFPSTPGRLKSGASAPISRVFTTGWPYRLKLSAEMMIHPRNCFIVIIGYTFISD
jgi:hypothetical protein